jgi:hypothetical protein
MAENQHMRLQSHHPKSMTTKEVIRKIIAKHEDSTNPYLTRSLAVLSHRPFNMKGQEIEEIVGHMLVEGLREYCEEANPWVVVPQNKKTADIEFMYQGERRAFDIKSYGGAERFQLSTLKTILQEIRNRFNGSESRELSLPEKEWLIQQINAIQIDYTLFFLSFVRDNEEIEVHIFDYESLSLERFKELPFQLKITGKEKRVEIFAQITKNSTLEVSSGANPLNRGLWINKIRTEKDMELIYGTEYFGRILKKNIQLPNFDKNQYIIDKAKKTIELINTYWKL